MTRTFSQCHTCIGSVCGTYWQSTHLAIYLIVNCARYLTLDFSYSPANRQLLLALLFHRGSHLTRFTILTGTNFSNS